MKRTALLLLMSGAVLNLASCTDGELQDLVLDPATSTTFNYEISPSDTVTIPFSIKNVEFEAITVDAVSSDADYPALVTMNENNISGNIKVAAPKYVFEEKDFTVTLNVEDAANSRTLEQVYNFKGLMADNYQSFTTNANTYIVTPGAFVKINGVKGNGSETLSFDSAELLWADNAALVEAVMVHDGNIYANLRESESGNAVVTAKSGNDVVWSWTLWVSSYNPEDNCMTYTSSNGKTYTFMDRNLGALSNEVGTAAVHGNMYQWGRKDAFPGMDYTSERKAVYNINGETVEVEYKQVAEVDNIPVGIATPLTHYQGVGGGNYSWLTSSYNNCPKETVKDLWGNVSDSKSVYDPCPAGWRVPEREAFYFWGDKDVTKTKTYVSEDAEKTNTNFAGWTVTIDGKDYFFPNQGEVPHGSSPSYGVGSTWPCGKMWSSSTDSFESSSYFRAFSTSISPSSTSWTSGLGFGYELAVRCVKE